MFFDEEEFIHLVLYSRHSTPHAPRLKLHARFTNATHSLCSSEFVTHQFLNKVKILIQLDPLSLKETTKQEMRASAFHDKR